MSDALWQETGAERDVERKALADRYGIPPFTTLNTRTGEWQRLKAKWRSLGIRSEEGRSAALIPTGENSVYSKHHGGYKDAGVRRPEGAIKPFSFTPGRTAKDTFGRDKMPGHRSLDGPYAFEATQTKSLHHNLRIGVDRAAGEGEEEAAAVPPFSTSIFDPVLCQLCYEWFCPPGGWILDPFAGGSVRGLVAAKLGRPYVGCDLSAEQVEANWGQWVEIGEPGDAGPAWLCGDSARLGQVLDARPANIAMPPSGAFDFVFSCPPYHDLEQYGDDPADISNMSYSEFLAAYAEIISNACALLAPDRFAAFVVGDIRDRRSGMLRGFVGATVASFREAGLGFYNEAILETSVASAPLRAKRMFEPSRKLVKVHQNVLVFCKGSPQAAVAAMGREVVHAAPPPEMLADGSLQPPLFPTAEHEPA